MDHNILVYFTEKGNECTSEKGNEAAPKAGNDITA